MVDRWSTPSSDPDREVGTVVASLRQGAGSALPERDLETAARGLERFREARVRDFVPLFVEHQVRADLRTLAAHRPATLPSP